MSSPAAGVDRHATVVFQPWGRRWRAVLERATLLTVAQEAGIPLSAGCGGAGTCAECVVRVVGDGVSDPTQDEVATLLPEDLDAGLRLACQTVFTDDRIPVIVEVAPEHRIGQQRSQVEGIERPWPRRPSAHATSLRLPGTRLLGVAVDVGTTGLAVHLIDLEDGSTLGARGSTNPQIAYGEDVMSRLATVLRAPDRAVVLRDVLVEELNRLVATLCRAAAVSPERIVEVVAVGNTAMHHLLLGLPVGQLGLAPYRPATTDAVTVPASDIGLHAHPQALVVAPPTVAGFVGGDHVAALLAIGPRALDEITLVLDIGTNTEISLLTAQGHWCCAAASGPAFEGAHIDDGMRAVDGAIEQVTWDGDRLAVRTIGDAAPIGLCGSGLIDAVAVLATHGVVTSRGAYDREHPLVVAGERRRTWVELAPASPSGAGSAVRLSRQDVGEVQMAKAAVRAGIKLLTETAGIGERDIQRVILAGAFGTELKRASARAIGLIPPIALDRIQQVGNAAVSGARRLLLDASCHEEAVAVAASIEYVELTGHPDFQDRFTLALSLATDPWDA